MGEEPSFVDAFRVRGGKVWTITLPQLAVVRLLEKYCDDDAESR